MRSKNSLLGLSCILACGVCAAAAWLYWPSLDQPFHFDDQLFLRDDNVRLGRWQAFLLPPVIRSLTWLTFLTQYRMEGASPLGYHAFNLILHAANSVLVFALLWILLRRFGRGAGSFERRPMIAVAAALGAFVFALHPVQSESVLLVYQRSTLLAAFFGLLALLCWIHPRRRGGGDRDWTLEPLAGICFLLAVTAKESAIVLPLVFWIFDGLFAGRWKPSKALLLLLAIGGVSGLTMLTAGLETGQIATLSGIAGVAHYASAQVRVVWLYVGLILGVGALNIDHDARFGSGVSTPLWWLALAGLAVLVWALWQARRRNVPLSFFGLSFFLLLLPSSSFIPSPDLAFEHRVYAPMLGVAGMVAALALWLAETGRGPKRGARSKATLVVLMVTVGVTLFLMADSTRRRISVWRDPVALWRDTVMKSPDKYRPNFNLGVLLLDAQPREADRYLSRAIEIDPNQPLAYRSLGESRLRQGLPDAAERLWKQALLLDPNDFDTLLALGKLDRSRRRYFEAQQRLQTAERLRPNEWEVHYQLGKLQADFGFLVESVPYLERALELNPSLPALYYALAEPMARTSNWERAIELYKGGLALAPDDAGAHYRLALIYRQAGRMEEAQAEVEKGLALSKTASELEAGRTLLDSH